MTYWSPAQWAKEKRGLHSDWETIPMVIPTSKVSLDYTNLYPRQTYTGTQFLMYDARKSIALMEKKNTFVINMFWKVV